MQIIIENMKTQKQTSLEVPEDFITESDDMLVHLGLERFKLVTTKTEKDIQRETLSLQLGEELYPGLFEQYPQYGTEEDNELTETIKTHIRQCLEQDKYEALKNDEQPERLLNMLATAFGNYCNVFRTIKATDARLLEKRLHENVFFDYLLQFTEVFKTSKTLKDIHEQVQQLHQDVQVDPRGMYGYDLIFACLKPYLDLLKELTEELTHTDAEIKLEAHPLFTDEQYLADHANVPVSVVCQLNGVYTKYTNLVIPETVTYKGKEYDGATYSNLVTIMNMYQNVLDKRNILHVAAMARSQDATVDITNEITEFTTAYSTFIQDIIELQVRSMVQPQNVIEHMQDILNAQFHSVLMVWHPDVEKDTTNKAINDMMQQMTMHLTVLEKILLGKLEPTKLVHGEYTHDEIIAPLD